MKAKHTQPATEALPLLRQAASYGPGHRGHRTEASPTERASLRDRLESLGLDPPLFLDREQTWVDRKAKLFEAGEYKDKGVTVTGKTLDTLVTTFDLPVPVLIEHAKSPLQIGFLTNVQADGQELFGTIALTKEANDLIEASGAHALSLGLSADLTTIQEVSLVKKPRVASARLFTGEVLADEPDWKSECARLEVLLAKGEFQQRISVLVSEGRLVPAQVPFVEALARSADSVEFDGDTLPISRLVLSLIEAAPRHAMLLEHAPSLSQSGPALHPDERAFYDRYFAGLSIEDIAKNKRPA